MKMSEKIPSTDCARRLLMKFRRIREAYWLEAIASAIKVMDNVTPTTDIIEPATVVDIPRAPSAPAPHGRGRSASQRSLR